MFENFNIHYIPLQISNGEWPIIFSSLKEIEEKSLQEEIIFRNKDYPLYPSLVILDSHARQKAKYISERLIELLERVITICRFEEKCLDFFMLNEKQKKLFSIPSSIPKEIVISRFDAFLNEKEKKF